MGKLAKSSWYKFGLSDNWGLHALVGDFIAGKIIIIITYIRESCLPKTRNCVYRKYARNEEIFLIHKVFLKLTLDLNS